MKRRLRSFLFGIAFASPVALSVAACGRSSGVDAPAATSVVAAEKDAAASSVPSSRVERGAQSPSDAASLSDAEVRALVRRELRLMDSHPPKCMPSGSVGEHGDGIKALGKRAVPPLLEAITDTTPTTWGYANHMFVVGDFALLLLDDVCNCPPGVYETPPGSVGMRYLEAKGARARAQAAWKAYAARDGGC